jgi:predicted metalloprotease
MTKIRSTDDSRVQDRRGRRGRGGGGFSLPGLGRRGGGPTRLPLPGGKAGGGGILALIVIAAVIFLPRLLSGGDGTTLFSDPQEQVSGGAGDGEACQTEAEQIVCGAVNDVQGYWERAYPDAFGEAYQFTDLVFFSGAVDTGCGPASSQTGPFYCPGDGYVYIDLEFMAALQDQFGAQGDLATQYIVAHEFGHHVQNLTGANAEVQQSSGDRQRHMSIALELQADCYAGAWVHDAQRRQNEAGEDLIEDGEIGEALDAAAAVGDDRIQMQTQGRADPESFTHGTSAQREQWFRRGYATGDPQRCNTFDEL